MPRGAISSEGSSGENIQHFSTIRIRATGQGSLKIVAHSMDNITTKVMAPLQIFPKNRVTPNRIVNFVEQRVFFEISTTGFEEYFRIARIVVYMKEIYTSHPGA